MENIIICKDLIKTYTMGKEKVQALNGLSLDIQKGDFCALLGKSGSGKSTLLNMMAGLEPPTKGYVMLKGNNLGKLNETKITNIRKKHVGFIFQSYNLIPTHTALENVTMPLVFNNMPKKQRVEQAKHMLDLVGLGDRLYHKPFQMSGGQQQRVSIARAFVNNPEIIFADEPTGNLDTKTTDEIMELMLKLINEHNQTFIMVTHDPETSEYANKIVHMIDGKIDNIIYKENGGNQQ
jgi:putative ABC transport system ATP-binding protein